MKLKKLWSKIHAQKNEWNLKTEGELLNLLKNDPNLMHKKFHFCYSFMSILPRIYLIKNFKSEKYMIFKQIIDLAWAGNYYNTHTYFIASAKCDLEYLQTNVDNLKIKNSTQEGDTPLQYLLKFGDYDNENFVECLKLLITKENVNKLDYNNKKPLDVVRKHHDKSNDIIQILSEAVQAESKHTQLFNAVISNNLDVFKNILKEIKDRYNYDDGENTLLQLCVMRKQWNMVELLITNAKTDINKITIKNNYHPILLMAIIGKNQSDKNFYCEFLKQKRLRISKELFHKFIEFRSNPIKMDFFDKFLECEAINVDMKMDDQQENTPLHYAIIFGNKHAIQGMLKRGASLYTKNGNQKSCLDMIQTSDMNKFLNSCINLDNYTNDVYYINYKFQLNYQFLPQDGTEMNMLSSTKFKDLLNHVLLDIFIYLKWNLAKSYLIWFSAIRLIHIVFTTMILFNIDNIERSVYIFSMILIEIFQYVIMKQFCNNDKHSNFEKLLTCLIFLHLILILFNFNFIFISAIIYVIMATSFLLLVGYHPYLSKWSVMLQNVYISFFKLHIFFSPLILAFTLGFCQLFREKKDVFKNIQSSVFSVLVMLTGEFNAFDVFIQDNITIFNQLFFIIFVINISVVLMNFWIAITVSDIGITEKYELDGHINTIKFLLYVENFYINYGNRFLFKTHCPLLFPENKNKTIDIYINKTNGAFDHKFLKDLELNVQIKTKLINLYNERTNI